MYDITKPHRLYGAFFMRISCYQTFFFFSFVLVSNSFYVLQKFFVLQRLQNTKAKKCNNISLSVVLKCYYSNFNVDKEVKHNKLCEVHYSKNYDFNLYFLKD